MTRESEMSPRPLQKRTMTLSQLQMRTLDVLRKVRFQLQRPHWAAEGMTDAEFLEQIICPLETDIYQDRQILKMAKKEKRDGA
jgi:hypothetical protein